MQKLALWSNDELQVECEGEEKSKLMLRCPAEAPGGQVMQEEGEVLWGRP